MTLIFICFFACAGGSGFSFGTPAASSAAPAQTTTAPSFNFGNGEHTYTLYSYQHHICQEPEEHLTHIFEQVQYPSGFQ